MAARNDGEAREVGGRRTPADATEAGEHRVRFSRDLERVAVSPAAAGVNARPGTPVLRVDTASASASASAPPVPVSAPVSAGSKASPTSPRARDRGYSLRRSLFARTIQLSPARDLSPIELVEAGSSRRGVVGGDGEEMGKGKATDAEIAVSPVADPGADSGLDARFSLSRRSTRPSAPESKKDRKTFGTGSLPNYDVWARSRKRKRSWQKKVSHLFKVVVADGIFGRKALPPSADGRHIDLNVSRKQPLMDERNGQAYVGNSIRSSRYTIWDFLPRQLFFQFSKLANAYFLLVSILQMIPGLSPTGSYTTIAPLLAFVTISMCKEGYDDVRRYKLDKVENNKETKVLRASNGVVHRSAHKANLGQRFCGLMPSKGDSPDNSAPSGVPRPSGAMCWTPLKWKDVTVGDVIQLHRDDDVPADVVLLHADGPNGIAFIETMALDGETNLKTKQAVPPLAKRCTTLDEIAACTAEVVVEDPNLDLVSFFILNCRSHNS